jgi:hypothetical protein
LLEDKAFRLVKDSRSYATLTEPGSDVEIVDLGDVALAKWRIA